MAQITRLGPPYPMLLALVVGLSDEDVIVGDRLVMESETDTYPRLRKMRRGDADWYATALHDAKAGFVIDALRDGSQEHVSDSD